MRFGVKAAGVATGQGLRGYLQHRSPLHSDGRIRTPEELPQHSPNQELGAWPLAPGLNGAARPTRAPAGTDQHN